MILKICCILNPTGVDKSYPELNEATWPFIEVCYIIDQFLIMLVVAHSWHNKFLYTHRSDIIL